MSTRYVDSTVKCFFYKKCRVFYCKNSFGHSSDWILGSFQAIADNSRGFLELQNKCDLKLTALRDDIAADLYDLEEEYYLSLTKYGDREKEKCETR